MVALPKLIRKYLKIKLDNFASQDLFCKTKDEFVMTQALIYRIS